MIGNGQVRFGEGWLEKGLNKMRNLVSHLLYIVWDATEVMEYSRSHSGKASRTLAGIREILEQLVEKRDARKDAFAGVITKAMQERYGDTKEDVEKHLAKSGFTHSLANRAAEIAHQKGSFSIWSVVDALTQLSREAKFAGTRVDADRKAARLLELVA